ncbi:MAG: hypothetical protein R6X19_04950 [Kiritimatiellia bacterium]
MLNLSATTILTPEEAIERALACFGGGKGLKLVELAGHVHGREGSLEITVGGDPVVGREAYEPLELLNAILRDLRDRYGLSVMQLALHFHTVPNDESGHLMVQVEATPPVEVRIESDGLDQMSRDFLDGLPRPERR